MKQFAALVQSLSHALDSIAGFCIVATMAVVVLNIVLRVALGNPLLGTMDYVTLLMALTVGLGLAYCGFKNGHIAVDLIIEKLSKKTQAIIDTFTNLISLVFWAVSAWYMMGYARTMAQTNLVAPTTQIPLYPVIYLISFGLMVLCLVLVLKISDAVRKVTK
ncbi:MAG: TRAP transporter small permease [Firmicutes bacterium HGW-Firmicutes-15]|nr:MAG: TRAP transporter small permease [Firmicutes bacterium HGW-Firmicutes-15]